MSHDSVHSDLRTLNKLLHQDPAVLARRKRLSSAFKCLSSRERLVHRGLSDATVRLYNHGER